MPKTAHFHVPSIRRCHSDQGRYVHDEQKTDSRIRLKAGVLGDDLEKLLMTQDQEL